MTRSGARRLVLVVATLLVSPALSGCGAINRSDVSVLERAIKRTEERPHSFVYVDKGLFGATTVAGTVEDPYRYKFLLSVNGVPTWQEVVRDDAAAEFFPSASSYDIVRFAETDPTTARVLPLGDRLGAGARLPLLSSRIARFQSEGATGPGGQSDAAGGAPGLTSISAPSVATTAALRAGTWVLDPVGAPQPPSVGDASSRGQGDPFYAAQTALEHVRQTILTNGVHHWVKSDVLPAYMPKEDPFPKPTRGQDRYDVSLRALPLPNKPDSAGKSRDKHKDVVVPDSSNFVRMAIYLQDGLVAKVLEVVDPLFRIKEVARNYGESFTKIVDLTEKTLRSFGGSDPTVVQQFAVQEFVRIEGGAAVGGNSLRVHQTSLEFVDVGKPVDVVMPTPAVQAPLGSLPFRGRREAQPSATASPSPSPVSSETSPPASRLPTASPHPTTTP